MFKKITIYKKLIIESIFLAIIPLIVGVSGYWGLTTVTSYLKASVEERLPSIEALKTMQVGLQAIRIAQRTYLNPALSEEEFKRQDKNIAAAREKYQVSIAIYAPIKRGAEKDDVWKQLLAAVEEWKKENDVFFGLAKEYGTLQEKYFKSKRVAEMSYRDATSLATITSLEILYNFKKQVQEWKDILIRGGDQAKYDKHFALFEKQEKTVKEKLELVKSLLADLGESTSDVESAIQKHAELGTKYREALKHFDKDSENQGKAVDTIVAGIDRPFTEALDSLYGNSVKLEAKTNDLRSKMTKYSMVNCRNKEIVAMGILDKLIAKEVEEADTLRKSAEKSAWTAEIMGLFFSLAGTALALVAGFLLAFSITVPLKKLVESVKVIAAGDMTHEVDLDRHDEIGILADAINKMVASLGGIIQDLKSNTVLLTDSSGQLSDISVRMETGAREAADMVSSVSAAAEEMSINASDIASSMREASQNLNTVAVAAEEMTSTVAEISVNSEKARGSAQRASHEARDISTVVAELGESARNIGEVTDTIAGISAQTNLLALNATIEAARAGEAGKGFAVVASEIKDLASQTSAAVSDIGERIANIQNTVMGAVSGITGIAGTIEDVNGIVSTIAEAIEEQSTALSEVALNAAKISSGVEAVNVRVSQMASASGEVAGEMSKLENVASVISDGSRSLKDRSSALSGLSENLKNITSSFKV